MAHPPHLHTFGPLVYKEEVSGRFFSRVLVGEFTSVFQVEDKIYLKWNFLKRNKYKEVHLLCILERIYFCLCREDICFPGSDFS